MTDTTATTMLDPLVDSRGAREIAGGKRRETLCRWIARGIFPKPDRIINGKNYWHRSTLERWLEREPEAAA